jgi:hypothetical protein
VQGTGELVLPELPTLIPQNPKPHTEARTRKSGERVEVRVQGTGELVLPAQRDLGVLVEPWCRVEVSEFAFRVEC